MQRVHSDLKFLDEALAVDLCNANERNIDMQSDVYWFLSQISGESEEICELRFEEPYLRR